MDDTLFAQGVMTAYDTARQNVIINYKDYVFNPDKDFTRKRKISFADVIDFNLQIGSKSLQNELNDRFMPVFKNDTPFKSAFCAQRDKVKTDAFKHIFEQFTQDIMELDDPKLVKGYRLLAADGSDITLPFTAFDDSYRNGDKSKKEHKQVHLNCVYDCENGIYVCASIRSDDKKGERSALIEVAEQLPKNSIITADKGYECYDLFWVLNNAGLKYLIRIKSEYSNGILSTWEFQHDENGEFDEQITFRITCLQTNEMKNNKEYQYVSEERFHYYDETKKAHMNVRIVCVKLSTGEYEYLATNLSEEEFNSEEIKELYHRRWEIETSFRNLKHTIDVDRFHCIKPDAVEKELWAKLTVFNYVSSITHHIDVPVKEGLKYQYKINFSNAVGILRKFIKGEFEFDPIPVIKKFLVPVKPGKSNKRKKTPRKVKGFLYRSA